MEIDIILYVLSGLCLIAGVAGCFLPVLPGSPLSYIGMLLLHFTGRVQFSIAELVVMGIVVVVVQVLDYLTPLLGARAFGGTKWGNRGCVVGTIVGLFFMPPGIIVGPFLGAVVGELLSGRPMGLSLKAGFGSFVGFLFSTLLKVALCLYFIVRIIVALV